jgi:hypothetical protein
VTVAGFDGPDPSAERPSHWERRRQRLAADVARSRSGDHRVPTWLMAVALIAIVGVWLALIFLS